MELLFQIIAPHFVAGFIVSQGRIIKAAPIIKYMLGWEAIRTYNYCKSKKWTFVEVKPKCPF